MWIDLIRKNCQSCVIGHSWLTQQTNNIAGKPRLARSSTSPKALLFPAPSAERMTSFSHYEILGVAKTATDDEIKIAYRKIAKHCHPDKFPLGANIMKLVNQAKQDLDNGLQSKEWYLLDRESMTGYERWRSTRQHSYDESDDESEEESDDESEEESGSNYHGRSRHGWEEYSYGYDEDEAGKWGSMPGSGCYEHTKPQSENTTAGDGQSKANQTSSNINGSGKDAGGQGASERGWSFHSKENTKPNYQSSSGAPGNDTSGYNKCSGKYEYTQKQPYDQQDEYEHHYHKWHNQNCGGGSGFQQQPQSGGFSFNAGCGFQQQHQQQQQMCFKCEGRGSTQTTAVSPIPHSFNEHNLISNQSLVHILGGELHCMPR